MLLRLLGFLMLATALALPLLRAPDRPVETLVARWAPPPSDFMDLQGQLVHYRDEGPRNDPQPLLLLHGTSSSLHTWEGWIKALRGQRRVISLDLPGFGLTGPWTEPTPALLAPAQADQPYAAAAYLPLVLAVLDKLGAQRVVAVGNSLGGEVAWRLAQQSPARVAALVLVDSAGYQASASNVPMAWQFARLPVLGNLTKHLMLRPLVVQGLVAVVGDPKSISDAQVDRYVELNLREGNRGALVQRARQWTAGSGVDRITGITQPTLLLWGGRDRLIPPAVAQQFQRDIPGSRLVMFDRLGHIPQEEDPVATVAEVRRFLAQLGP